MKIGNRRDRDGWSCGWLRPMAAAGRGTQDRSGGRQIAALALAPGTRNIAHAHARFATTSVHKRGEYADLEGAAVVITPRCSSQKPGESRPGLLLERKMSAVFRSVIAGRHEGGFRDESC